MDRVAILGLATQAVDPPGPLLDRARVPVQIENESHGGLHLLRLEFEILLILDTPPAVSSSGKIACRDLVVGPAVDVSRDASLTAYADALGVRNPTSDRQWLNLANKVRWISVEFGPIDERDQRNSFQAIHPFELAGRSVREYDYSLDQDWVPVNVAADQLERSESTIRRRLAELEPNWGANLVSRTLGNHRRINLPLLRNLWTRMGKGSERGEISLLDDRRSRERTSGRNQLSPHLSPASYSCHSWFSDEDHRRPSM